MAALKLRGFLRSSSLGQVEDERHTARGRKTWYDVCTVSHAEPHKTKRIADERAQHAQVAEAHVYESTRSPSRATSVVFEESVHQKVRAADHIQPWLVQHSAPARALPTTTDAQV